MGVSLIGLIAGIKLTPAITGLWYLAVRKPLGAVAAALADAGLRPDDVEQAPRHRQRPCGGGGGAIRDGQHERSLRPLVQVQACLRESCQEGSVVR